MFRPTIILPRFRDIAGFLLKSLTFSYSASIILKFGDVPLDLIADLGSPKGENPRLIIRVITFEVRSLHDHSRPTSTS